MNISFDSTKFHLQKTLAKLARDEMVRFMAENHIQYNDDIKSRNVVVEKRNIHELLCRGCSKGNTPLFGTEV